MDRTLSKGKKIRKKAINKMLMAFDGDPVGIRTLDLLIRSQSLYPAELPSHVGMKANLHSIFCGRGRRNRTLNQWFWRPLLYQLSYTPRMERKTRFELATPSLARRCSTTELFPQMATRMGLEPTTSAVTGRHSNQLNHRAICQ